MYILLLEDVEKRSSSYQLIDPTLGFVLATHVATWPVKDEGDSLPKQLCAAGRAHRAARRPAPVREAEAAGRNSYARQHPPTRARATPLLPVCCSGA